MTKEWYDGYRFGNAEIYCPWDVINWICDLRSESNPEPKDYWVHTSGNDIINTLAKRADEKTEAELNKLLDGQAVAKEIIGELTYRELYKKKDNIWSMLLNTGYLTVQGKNSDGTYDLVLPNREIRDLFARMLKDWFEESVKNEIDNK